jgi:hypothetical protein
MSPAALAAAPGAASAAVSQWKVRARAEALR